MRNFGRSITLLSLNLLSEALIVVSLVWTVLQKGGSTTSLGICLSLTAVIPYLLQKTSRRLLARLVQEPYRFHSLLRGTGLAVSLLALAIPARWGVLPYYLLAGVFSVITFFSTQCLETFVSGYVRLGKLSYLQASRMLQTTLQLAGIFGGMIAGALISGGGFKLVLLAIAGSYLVGAVGLGPLRRQLEALPVLMTHPAQESARPAGSTVLAATAFSILAFVALRISAINLLVPYLIQKQFGWAAAGYGVLEAMTALGALSASLFLSDRHKLRWIWACAFLFIAAQDQFYALASALPALMALSMVKGFFTNALRIKQWEVLFSQANDTLATARISANLALATTLVKASVPLVLGYCLSRGAPALWFTSLSLSTLAMVGGAQILQTILGKDPAPGVVTSARRRISAGIRMRSRLRLREGRRRAKSESQAG